MERNTAPLAAAEAMTADLAARIYARHGVAWPVSGDMTAQVPRHRDRRVRDRMLRRQGSRKVVMAGRYAPMSADLLQRVLVEVARDGWVMGCGKCNWAHSFNMGPAWLRQRQADDAARDHWLNSGHRARVYGPGLGQ